MPLKIKANEPKVLSKSATVEEALKLAEGGRILSNGDWDKMIVGSDKWEKYKQALPAWTGTMAAYAEPGKKLGKQVEYTDPETKEVWVFPVPEKWQNETNAMLKVEHPHYDIKVEGNRKTVIVDNEANISLVRDFPAENSWRRTKDGIPCGETVDSSSSDARYLYRADRLVGLVARVFGGRRDVGLFDGPSLRFGVVAIGAGEAGAPQKLAVEREEGRLVITGSQQELDEIAHLIKERKQQ